MGTPSQQSMLLALSIILNYMVVAAQILHKMLDEELNNIIGGCFFAASILSALCLATIIHQNNYQVQYFIILTIMLLIIVCEGLTNYPYLVIQQLVLVISQLKLMLDLFYNLTVRQFILWISIIVLMTIYAYARIFTENDFQVELIYSCVYQLLILGSVSQGLNYLSINDKSTNNTNGNMLDYAQVQLSSAREIKTMHNANILHQSQMVSDNVFKAFNIMPEAVIVLEVQDLDVKVKYANTASESVFGHDKQILCNNFLNLNLTQTVIEQEDTQIKFQQSLSSYKSIMPQNSNQQNLKMQKQPARHSLFQREAASRKGQMKRTSLQEQFNQNNSNYLFLTNNGNQNKTEILQDMYSNKNGNQSKLLLTQTFKSKDSDTHSNSIQKVLLSLWSQTVRFLQDQSIAYQPEEPLLYIHESDIYVTTVLQDGNSRCMDVKIFSAVFNKEPIIIVMLRDVSHRDYIKILQDHNQQKSKTLSFVSHEYRTPLNCVISMLESVIDKNHISDEDDKLMVQSSIDNCKYILNLSNDLLDLAQMKSGKFQMNNVRFNLKKLFQECIQLFSIQARKKNILLELKYDKHVPDEIVCDQNRIRQVTINLIGNAMKFTLKGSISVIVSPMLDDEISVEVKDTGIGVKKEDVHKLLQAFGKIENKESQNLNAQGVGLGLMISNSIVMDLSNNHQGLGFNSVYGEGTTFCFLIQNKEDPKGVEVENLSESKALGDEEDNIEQNLSLIRRHTNFQLIIDHSKEIAYPTILIVDDNQFNIDSLILLLDRQFKGVKCDYTISGYSAEETIQQRFDTMSTNKSPPYKLLFMDVEMPFQDGIVTSTNIKQMYSDRNLSVNIVGCSGYVSSDEQQACLSVMDAYVTKPVSKLELERVMNTYYFD